MKMSKVLQVSLSVICISALLLASHPVFSQENNACGAKAPSELIQVLDESIALNEKFKISVGGREKVEYQRRRTKLEKYDEETAIPCVRHAVQLLIKRPDSVLLHKLMEFTISHENSADETPSYALGRLFAFNPVAVEHAIEKFPARGKKIIVSSVEAGWMNVRPDFPPTLRKNREERLAKLRSLVAGPVESRTVRR